MNACPARPDVSAATTLDPDPRAWAGMLDDSLNARGDLTDEARVFREQLGLPTGAPIVMSGHQPGFWHAGIFAKLLAANALAARTGAHVAWIVIDFDEHWAFTVPIPMTDPEGRLRAQTWSTDGRDSAGGEIALTRRAASPALPHPPRGWSVPAPIAERTREIVAALGAHTDAPNAAVQVTEAVFDLLDPVTPRPTVVHASAIAQTDLFARAVELAARRPATPHNLFNDAASHHPGARVRELATREDGDVELPFWKLAESNRLRPAFGGDLAEDRARLLPRGMLATGLMRLAGCDLFVHGTGGRAYEPINDRWLARWMGGSRLAPFVTASADLLLDLPGESVTQKEAARAAWRAHHARHHPGKTGDDRAQRERDRLVGAIRAAPRGSPERGRLYRELHTVLRAHRESHAGELRALGDDARALGVAAGEQGVREARDWAAALHAPERLEGLRGRVESAFDE